MAPAEVEAHSIPGGPDRTVSITLVRPVDQRQPAGGRLHARRRLGAREFRHPRAPGARSGAKPEPRSSSSNYPRSPEARYPIAIEQVYATVKWVAEHGAELGLDGSGWRSPGTASAAI